MAYIQKTKTLDHVSIYEAKQHLRIDLSFTDDDKYLSRIIRAASQFCENYIGKDISLTSNVASYFDINTNLIRIDEGHLVSVDKVGDDLSIGVVKSFYNYFEVHLIDQAVTSSKYAPITVEYTTGFNEGECPEDIKQGILIKMAMLYDEERSDYVWSQRPKTNVLENILNSHKIILF